MDADLHALTEELRFVLGLDEDGSPDATAAHAQRMAQKAAGRGDQKAVGYWRGVYANAKGRLAKAAGKDPHAHGHAPAPAGDQPKKSWKDKLKGAAQSFAKGAKAAASGAIEKLKNAPAETKRLVMDAEYRKEAGKAAAAKIKKTAAKIALHVVDEVEEVAKAGGVLTKAARGKKLTDEDKHVLKAGAKALASTVIGTVAVGGIAHLTANALATHFALETAAKSIGKAALYAELASEAEEQAGLKAWAEDIIKGIVEGFEKLGDMSPDELADILAKED